MNRTLHEISQQTAYAGSGAQGTIDAARAAAIGASGTIAAADAARSAANTAAKALEVSDRAWISVDASVSGPLTFDDTNGVYVGFRFTLNNVGRSPAQGVHISPELVMTVLLSNTESEQKRICEGHAKAVKAGVRHQEYTVFPGEPDIEEERIQLSTKEIDAFYSPTEKALGGRPDPLPIGLVGCVDYTFLSSPVHHQTGFAFQILTRDTRGPLISQTPIAANHLMLLKTPLGRYFIN